MTANFDTEATPSARQGQTPPQNKANGHPDPRNKAGNQRPDTKGPPWDPKKGPKDINKGTKTGVWDPATTGNDDYFKANGTRKSPYIPQFYLTNLPASPF